MKPGIGLLLVGYRCRVGSSVRCKPGRRGLLGRPRAWILGAHYGRGAATGFVSRTDSIREGTRTGWVGQGRAARAAAAGAPSWRPGSVPGAAQARVRRVRRKPALIRARTGRPVHRRLAPGGACPYPVARPQEDAAAESSSHEHRRMRTITESFARASAIGTSGQPRERARQISLVNELALYPFTATIPYQLVYLLADPGSYLPILLANVGFMACYVAVLFLNRAGMHRAARNLAVPTVHLQIIVVTYLISAGSGVHLFFFPIGTWLGLFSPASRTRVVLAWGLAAFFFLLCHCLFPAGTAPLAIPEPELHVVFGGSAVCTMIVA